MRILWCVAILAAGAAYGQEKQPGQGVNFFSREKEIALGQSLAAEESRHTTPLDSAAVNEYVRRVGAALAAAMPVVYSYEFHVIQEDSGGVTHEPVAFPGGPIFVSQYLIAAAQNEAEFAGMLAHAMAHVQARHWTRQVTKAELSQVGWVASGGQPVPLGQIQFQRANEREADFLAVRAMAAAGYDPAGLASYIQRLQVPAATVLATLPDRDQRTKDINQEIGTLPQRTYQQDNQFARVKSELKLLP